MEQPRISNEQNHHGPCNSRRRRRSTNKRN
jgi:hypothetical protein